MSNTFDFTVTVNEDFAQYIERIVSNAVQYETEDLTDSVTQEVMFSIDWETELRNCGSVITDIISKALARN